MPAIPITHQYYPSVPISELTDLYSKGNNTLARKKAFIASYLPKTLRLSEANPFNNVYSLFIEDTALVNNLNWEYQLYKNGEPVEIANFISIIGESDKPSYSLLFAKDSTDEFEGIFADKLVVKCIVILGDEELVLEVEHDLVQMIDIQNIDNIEEDSVASSAHLGSPSTTKYILNHLKDFLSNGEITWNNETIEIDESPEKKNNLLRIVTGITYYNVQHAVNNLNGIDFLHDLNQDKNLSAQTFLNSEKEHNGDYTNGLCKIPMHVLNEILTDISTVPDFTEIDSGDDSAIFNAIKGVGETTAAEKTKASIEKLEANKSRYVEIFNLSLFPKSSIKLCALVVKYLLEASKKNECNECLNREVLWKDVTIDELSENPDLLKNILTHYYSGPTNQVTSFFPSAKVTEKLIWTPFIELIIDIAPRIVKAYFAKRIIKKLEEERIDGVDTPVYTFEFVRLDSAQVLYDRDGSKFDPQPDYHSILGREVYIIIETLHARGQELTINVKPSNKNLNNSLNSLELRNGIEDTFSTDIRCTVGNTDDLKTNTLDPLSDTISDYLNIDFQDKVIKKVRLHPENREEYDNWTNHLASREGQLFMSGKFSDERMAYFGNDFTETRTSGDFLSVDDKYMPAQFKVVNRIVYEVHHKDNPWNFFSLEGRNRKRQGRIDNEYIKTILDGSPAVDIRNVVFFYYSQINEEIYIAECPYNAPRSRAEIPRRRAIVEGGPLVNNPDIIRRSGNGASNEENVPAGHIRDAAAPVGGDAFWNYYYPDGSIVTRDNPDAPRTDYGILRYRLSSDDVNDTVELVHMPELDIRYKYDGSDQRITFTFFFSQRRYSNPGCFGAFIGVLAEMNFDDMQSTGMCFADATSYPSRTHPNGDSIDSVHRNTWQERSRTIRALTQWGFGDIVTGSDDVFDRDGLPDHQRNADHNDHLHSGGFDTNTVEVII